MKKNISTSLFCTFVLWVIYSCAACQGSLTSTYDSLWNRYRNTNRAFILDCNRMLDTISRKALREQNEHQLFRTDYERMQLNRRYNPLWSDKTVLLYLDSVAALPHSAPYLCLYHYLTGTTLENCLASNAYATPIAQTHDLHKIDEWTREDLKSVSRQHFDTCFAMLQQLIGCPAADFSFMLGGDAAFRNLRPTLFDIVVQDRLTHTDDTAEAFSLIDKATGSHALPESREAVIDYELLRLDLRRRNAGLPKPEASDRYLKEVAALEKQYGNDDAFDYARGICLFEAGCSSDSTNDYFASALYYFDKLIAKDENPYFVQNALYCKEHILQPELHLNSRDQDRIPASRQRLAIRYRNIDSLYVSVYKTEKAVPLSYHYNPNLDCTVLDSAAVSQLGNPIRQERFALKNPVPYNAYTTELWLDSLPTGCYTLIFHRAATWDTASTMLTTAIHVTDIKLTGWSIGGKARLAVNHRTSGEPYAHRRTDVKGRIPAILFTNKNGEVGMPALLPENHPYQKLYHIRFRDHNDQYSTRLLVGRPYRRDRRFAENKRLSESGRICLFTDRTLYRPGQTLYFKSIAEHGGKSFSGQPVTITLNDKNGKLIDSLHLTSSDYGSTAGEFKIPLSSIGRHTLSVRIEGKKASYYARKSLDVAEYKLPAFSISLNIDTNEVMAGDTLTISGKVIALNGVSVADAAVSLQISTFGAPIAETFSGETEKSLKADVACDQEGQFLYRHALPASDNDYGVEVKATATDLNGETHVATRNFWIPVRSLNLLVTGLEDIDQSSEDTLRCTVRPVNHDDVLQPVAVRIRIEQLETPPLYRECLYSKTGEPSQPLYDTAACRRHFPQFGLDPDEKRELLWPTSDLLLDSTKVCKPDSALHISIKHWPFGNYKATFTCLDKKGDTVKQTFTFSIYRSDTTATQRYEPVWAYFKAVPQAGGEATVVAGTYLKDALLICNVYQGKRLLQTESFKLNRSQTSFTVKTRKHGGASVSVNVRVIQNGYCYQEDRTETLRAPAAKADSQTLPLELTHWNNLAEPGSQEHWELQIPRAAHTLQESAEVLAWMIDCSLYESGMAQPAHTLSSGGPNRYHLRDKVHLRHPLFHQYISFQDLSDPFLSHTASSPTKPRTIRNKTYETIEWLRNRRYRNILTTNLSALTNQNEPIESYDDIGIHATLYATDNVALHSKRKSSVILLSDMGEQDSFAEDTPSAISNEESADMTSAGKSGGSGATDSFSSSLKIRSQFKETAFFYPTLKTDQEGRLKIDFTLPDQYSKWQFFALAHTPSMQSGSLTAFLQSRKTLMTQGNAPRFLREGDTLTLQVRLTNLSDTALDGSVAIRLFNGTTGEPLHILVNGSDSLQGFRCAARGNAVAGWQIAVPLDVPLIGYRVLAQAGQYGDGEENVLPVLSRRTLVTESLPFSVPANRDTTLLFRKMQDCTSPTVQPYRYTMEITGNPTWIALQSLPYLSKDRYDCNEQIFSKLFADALALHIVSQHPEIERTYKDWQADSLHNSLASPLTKNEQLKSILLEETPWVADAKLETEQKGGMANLFDKKSLELQIAKQAKKLLRNQTAAGSWGWFGKGDGSERITNYIVAGCRKLNRLGINIPAADDMADKAIRYLDEKQESRYRQYVKEGGIDKDTPFILSRNDLQYLYIKTTGQADSAWLQQPYVKNLLAHLTDNLYEADRLRQAETALILHYAGRGQEARQVIEALRQQAVRSESMGMYWPDRQNGEYPCPRYFGWGASPVEQQTLFIEAFQSISPRQDELDAMVQWLLLQRKNSYWGNTKTTAEAVYAILSGNHGGATAASATVIRVGGQTFEPATDPQSEAGTEYLQHVWSADKMTPELAKITIRTDTSHSVYGGCYWQYLEDKDSITAAGAGLHIERALFHAAPAEGGRLDSVSPQNPARLGERITVRIVVTADRDLEYVHIKDERASSFEPVQTYEDYGWQNGFSYYEVTRDAATHFFIDTLGKGAHILEYEVTATQKGVFSNGIATVECLYSPEYRAQSTSSRVSIEP